MKVYVVVTKSNVHADNFEDVYGVYASLRKAEDMVGYLGTMGECASYYVSELEGE